MAQEEREEVAPGFYNDDDKASFVGFFIKPKRKAGRPRKRKRGRPRKSAAKNTRSATQNMIVDDELQPKAYEDMDARLEATIRATRAIHSHQSRMNWDLEPHSTLRDRIADSWIGHKDLWQKDESFAKFCKRMHISRTVLTRYLPKRKKELKEGVPAKPSKRGRKTHLSESVMTHICEGLCNIVSSHSFILMISSHSQLVIKRHDDQSEGLCRAEIIDVVRSASGWTLTKDQATYTWDDTIHNFGKKLGLLTGYVKPQQGTSKRTAAGSPALQKRWHIIITQLFKRVIEHNTKLIGVDKAKRLMSHLVFNLDEECVMATGKNIRIVGSRDKKKHDNEKGSSRDSITNIRYIIVHANIHFLL